MTKHRCIHSVLIFLAVLACGRSTARAETPAPPTDPVLRLHIQAPGIDHVTLHRDAADAFIFAVHMADGEVRRCTPEQFAALFYQRQTDAPWWKRLLNITSPIGLAWVALGLAGQVMFTGRMVVQWLVSERSRRSIVPPVFWWLSLAGASMLLAYFIWRKDVIGVLGQGTGWMIYTRNLYFIYRRGAGGAADLTQDPGPAPELDT